MALKIEVVVHGRMDIEEALGGSSRFKALHLALSSSYYLVRVLGPIVLPEPLLMLALQPDVPDGSAVRAQLIGYHRLWREALFSQQLAYQLDGRTPVSLALNQYVEDFAFVIPRSARDTSAYRRSERPSRRDASDRSAGDGIAGAVVR
jgi:hypothetical protein